MRRKSETCALSARLWILLPFLCLLLFGFNPSGRAFAASKTKTSELEDVNKWFILLNYDPSKTKATTDDMLKFDMGIMDADSHPPLSFLRNQLLLIAYLSVGEAEDYRSYWKQIKDKKWVLGENPNWKGNYYVDVRDKHWQKLILKDVIQDMIDRGFRGLMLDTLDTAEFLEERDPKKFKGSRKAMIDLVKKIRKEYPDLMLISNNGFAVLKDLSKSLDGFLVEGMFMTIDFEKNGYKPVTKDERVDKITVLREASKNRRIPVFNIEYVSGDNHQEGRRCIKASQALGYKPYVAEKDLNDISPVND